MEPWYNGEGVECDCIDERSHCIEGISLGIRDEPNAVILYMPRANHYDNVDAAEI